MQQLLEQYGYLATFLATFLEGETAVVIAGFAARRGEMLIVWVAVATTLGALVSDQLYFFLGRRYGSRILARKPDWERRSAKIRRYISERGTWFLFSFRFIYGIRTISPFMIGMSAVEAKRFRLINALSALVWGVGFSLVGFLVGAAAEQFIGRVGDYEGYIVAGLVVIGASVWVLNRVRTRKQQAGVEPESANSEAIGGDDDRRPAEPSAS